ncbi:hypothetical protein F5Y01DRAFT_298955 [Xylaria sp. FL0043]|nr:hypothetical protein F5Y01DRAFT_298955 [Xylaria sp. FL0043]
MRKGGGWGRRGRRGLCGGGKLGDWKKHFLPLAYYVKYVITLYVKVGGLTVCNTAMAGRRRLEHCICMCNVCDEKNGWIDGLEDRQTAPNYLLFITPHAARLLLCTTLITSLHNAPGLAIYPGGTSQPRFTLLCSTLISYNTINPSRHGK